MIKRLKNILRIKRDKLDKETGKDWSFGSDNQKRVMEFQKENYHKCKNDPEQNIKNSRQYFFDSNVYKGIFVNESKDINR